MWSFDLLTINSIADMAPVEIGLLKTHGFCYVKIDEQLEHILKNLSIVGHDFFNRSETEKQQFPIDINSEGYLNHRVKGTENIQRYIYHGSRLVEPFSSNKSYLDFVREYFCDQIGLPIIKKIFENMGISEHYADVVKDCSASLSFIFYPYPNKLPNSGLKAHKDIALVTVLFITDPGLEVYIDKIGWQEIRPKPGYVVLNLGNSLELMTGKNFYSALHRVNLTSDKARLSIATFLGPNTTIPMLDYTNLQQLYTSFSEFLKEQLKIIYTGF